ncbi:VOC family protein [Oculatella sp. LEGE 06141]|uniref:VOC family protein n=1 Tax=Oculatella sp. LEGE 06141 TaxID=1828648 RepID=UPI001880DB7F|nr:VOC family protein [Oculatella sp. LEGE 06141]MBE9178196.1 VOC family protein [Oculatella sp. LEGE 06141]
MTGLKYRAAFLALAEREDQSLVPFYQELLGQAPAQLIPGKYAEFELPGLRLGIFKPKTTHQPEFIHPSSGSMSLCLEVDDLEAAIAHLTALGCPPPGEPIATSHGREIYAYDPAGNRLILHQA